jgi:hypothetical protein
MHTLESRGFHVIENVSKKSSEHPRGDLSGWSLYHLGIRMLAESDQTTKPIMLAVMICLHSVEIKSKTNTTRETLVSSFTPGGVSALLANPLIDDKDKEVLELAIGFWTPYRDVKKPVLYIVD